MISTFAYRATVAPALALCAGIVNAQDIENRLVLVT
jgi:hypothetical protein